MEGNSGGAVEEGGKGKKLRRLPNPLVERYSSVSQGVKSPPPAKGCGARRVQRKPSSKRGTRTTRTRVTPRGRSARVCDEVEIQRVQETFGEDRKEGGRKGGGYASGRGQGDSGDPRRH